MARAINPIGQPTKHTQESLRLVEGFKQTLLAMAAAKGGTLTAAQIEHAAGAFYSRSEQFLPLFDRICRDCLTTLDNVGEEHRKDFFGRLLVGRFAHLLENGPEADEGAIPRVIINRFFEILQMMLGEYTLAEMHERCQALIDPIMEKARHDGKTFRFQDSLMEEDPEGRVLTRLALARLALHFIDFDKRKAWFMRFINTKLPHAETHDAHDAAWSFTDAHFEALTQALFAGLDADIRDRALATRIDKELGTGSVKTLKTVLQLLQRTTA